MIRRHPKKHKLSGMLKAHISGVYFLYSEEKLVYVGQSNNIYSRIADHSTDGEMRFDTWNYEEINDPTERISRERSAIMLYKPPLNHFFPGKTYWAPLRKKLNGIPVWTITQKAWPREQPL